MTDDSVAQPIPGRHLLVIDDDTTFRRTLVRAMERRGFSVIDAETVAEGLALLDGHAPDYAIIDMRLADGSGLDIVAALRERHADCRVVMLTAYGNIATAVAAVKAGAVDYLAKPAEPDVIEAALLAQDVHTLPPPPENPMSADRVKWEHIQRVFEQCDRNISETARRLKMHRRTLQRILSKHAPREQDER